MIETEVLAEFCNTPLSFTLDSINTSRMLGAGVTQPHLVGYRYLAQDGDGRWFVYINMPRLSDFNHQQWTNTGSGIWAFTGAQTRCLPDWNTTIIELPHE